MTEEFKAVVEAINKDQLINLLKRPWRFEFDQLHTALEIYAESFHMVDIEEISKLLRDFNMTGYFSGYDSPKGEICLRVISMKKAEIKSLLSLVYDKLQI